MVRVVVTASMKSELGRFVQVFLLVSTVTIPIVLVRRIEIAQETKRRALVSIAAEKRHELGAVELTRLLRSGQVIIYDVRPIAEFALGHLSGAVTIASGCFNLEQLSIVKAASTSGSAIVFFGNSGQILQLKVLRDLFDKGRQGVYYYTVTSRSAEELKAYWGVKS